MDLKQENETWETAFDQFMAMASQRDQDMVSSIQYFYECENSVQKQREKEFDKQFAAAECLCNSDLDMEGEAGEDVTKMEEIFSEEGLQELLVKQVSFHEEKHRLLAVEHAKAVRIFSNGSRPWELSAAQKQGTHATQADMENLLLWKKQMDSCVNAQNGGGHPSAIPPSGAPPMVDRLDETSHPDWHLPLEASVIPLNNVETKFALAQLDMNELKKDQWHVYEIIMWHLDQTLGGQDPLPLRMILHGKGRTGKS